MQRDILKIYDTPVLEFESAKDIEGYLSAHITRVYDEGRPFIPLDMKLPEEDAKTPEAKAGELCDEALTYWLRHRTIPRNRAYVQNLLDKMGLSVKDAKGILDICRGLSLNDSYWIVPKGEDWRFDDFNLYDNEFDETVANIAFDGQGTYSNSARRSSPEFTTGGMLAKAWRRIDGDIYLYKSGTTGFANAGHEPYSEYYAAQVAAALGTCYTPYDLREWRGMVCSVCKLWTDKDTAFIPIGRLVLHGGFPAIFDYCKELGDEYYQAVANLLMFDALILNEDRHFGNFGLLIDNNTNKPKGAAPIFDNGLALLWSMLDREMDDYATVIPNRLPRAYDDFIGTAKKYMTERQRSALKKVRDFEFSLHPEYNLDTHRVEVLSKVVREQARKLAE